MSANARGASYCAPKRNRTGLVGVIALMNLLSATIAGASETDRLPSNPAIVGSDLRCPDTPEFHEFLSLEQAIDSALCHNAHIRAAWENIRAASAAVGVADSAFLPTLSANLGELNDRTGYPNSTLPGSESTGHTIYASFDWRLFDFGGRLASRRAAKSLLEAAIQTRDATIERVLGSAIDAYFSAVTAHAQLNGLAEDERIAEETVASTQRRFTAGQGSQNDVLQARTALARSQLEHSRSINEYEKDRALLSYIAGISPGSLFELPDDVDVRTGMEEKDLGQWLQETQHNHPAILAAQANVVAAQQRVTAARSAGLPYVDWTADFYQNGFPNQGLASINSRVATVGVSVTIPLFDGFLTRHNVEEAKAAALVSEAQLDDTRDTTLMAVVEAYSNAQSALRNLEDSETLLSSAEAAFASSQRRYTQGATDIVELLSSQTALSAAKSERVRCISEWRAARLDLLSSAGILNRDDIHH